MLTNGDKKTIKDIVAGSLREFFETLILPYFEHNEKDHKEMKNTLREHDKRFDSMDTELDSIQRKLEKNEDDHEEIFQRLDRIEIHVTTHGKRIKRVETALSS